MISLTLKVILTSFIQGNINFVIVMILYSTAVAGFDGTALRERMANIKRKMSSKNVYMPGMDKICSCP